MAVTLIPTTAVCPVCGRRPYIERCEPWPRQHGPAPWAIGCYSTHPEEHFVGINGDTQLDAINLWNSEAEKIRAGQFDAA